MKTRVGIVDDHQLFLKSLSLLISGFNDFEVIVEALNGRDLQQKMLNSSVPDIFLIDVNMPVVNGIDTALWLHDNYPTAHLVALSMNDTDKAIISMIKAGCCAYLLKDTHPDILERALHEINSRGFYNAGINPRRLLMAQEGQAKLRLSEQELQFLNFVCSELTYKQIASKMSRAERTIDGYREELFKKFNVQSRVGLCLEAIRREIVKL